MRIWTKACGLSTKAFVPHIILILLSLFSVTLDAANEWSQEQKEACKALLSEYPSTIEPSFKNDAERKYWHHLILNDEAIHFNTVSFSKYIAEVQANPYWSCLYRSVNEPIDKRDVWRIEILEPHPMSSDSVILVVFISTNSKKILTAWAIPGG